MALTDFLFNGSPPASTTTYGSSTSSLPSWYNDYTQGLISKANALAATPYQAYSGARIADFQPQQQQAFQNVGNLAQQYAVDPNSGSPWAKAYQGAADLTTQGGQGTALGISGAGNVYNNALDPKFSNQFAQASGTTAQNMDTSAAKGIGQYLNPYTNSVVNDIGRQGQENLSTALNNVSDKFAGSGQYGGSRMGSALGSAARNTLRDTSGAQAGALNSAYGQALGASQQDLARQLQGAQQLGGLATTQQQNLANIGNQLGQFGSSDLSRQLQAGQNLGQLATQQAATGVSQNAALEAAGQSQQQQQQRSLDTAYQDYQNQLQYPYQQASFLNSIIRGLQIPQTTSTSSTGPASVYQPSPLAQLAAAGTGLAGLSKLGG